MRKRSRIKLLEMGIDVTSDDTKVVATGYGRIAVDFADHVITEITCHARGGRELCRGGTVRSLMWEDRNEGDRCTEWNGSRFPDE